MADPPTPVGKGTKLPKWAYLVAGAIGLLVAYFLLKGGKQTRQTSAGGTLSPDVAAAMSNQPSQNSAPAASLDANTLNALGYWFTHNLAGVSQDAGPGGSGGQTGAVSGQIFKCKNNNRECPPLMHCHNATGTCVPWPQDDPSHLHGCLIGEDTQTCENRLGVAA